jgi:hypothetical protein
LPRTDLVGVLLSNLLQPSGAACFAACCNTPACGGATFARAVLTGGARSADCYLYANVTQLVPSSVVDSALWPA